jgi:hypothetical protein
MIIVVPPRTRAAETSREQATERPRKLNSIRLCATVSVPFVLLLKPCWPCAGSRATHPNFVQHAPKKLICCLLALEIADYEAKPIFDQVRLTQDFHKLLADATVCAASHDLMSIEGEDGALLLFFCDPEGCFRTALAIREATLTKESYRDLQLRTGIDLGKVRIAEDEFGHPHVSGEGRQDADRLMRQGPPRQISVSRRFVDLLLRSAPELAEMLEYQGLYSNDVCPLHWYRAPAPQETASEGVSDQPPTAAVLSDVVDTPTQAELAPAAVPAESMTRLPSWLRRPRPAYALLVAVVGVAIVALSIRVGLNLPSFKRSAQVAVIVPQVTAPQAPASLPVRAEPSNGVAETLPAPVAPKETIGPVTTPAEPVKDPRASESVGSLLLEPAAEPAVASPRVKQHAPDEVISAPAPEKKKKRSKRESRNTADKEPQLPAQGEATTDAMLTCARIEQPAKRLECFDKLKRGGAVQTGNAGKG